MHQQIRTSPGRTGENVRRIVDALGGAGINIEGLGPDFEPPHVRTVVSHAQFDDAWTALKDAGLMPEVRPALTVAVADSPGALRRVLDDLARRGYEVESILVLASRVEGQVLVSIGIRETVPDDWEAKAGELGGWEEPNGWFGGDTD